MASLNLVATSHKTLVCLLNFVPGIVLYCHVSLVPFMINLFSPFGWVVRCLFLGQPAA